MRDEFLITRQGKQYVLFQGLLDEAHNRGLRGIDTELIQIPDDANGNVAIVKATVEMEGGDSSAGPRIFSGIGDASPGNVGRSIAPHIIRMAECVPLDSEILTRDGWKGYKEVRVGEPVLAYDVDTDFSRWVPLQAVNVFDPAPLVRLSNASISVVCTPEHSWPVKLKGKRVRAAARRLRKTNELRSSESLILSAVAESGHYRLSDRDAAVLGWLATDGSLREYYVDRDGHRWGPYRRAHIDQSKPDYVEEIRDLLGADATEHVANREPHAMPSGQVSTFLPASRFDLKSDYLRGLLDAAGISSWWELPALVTRLNSSGRVAMLDAMLKADGTRNERGRWVFGKKRKPGVMEAWEILATLEGYALGRLQEHRAVAVRTMRAGRFADANYLKVREVEPEPVWCPTTELGTWYMRQGSNICITGNTRAKARALRDAVNVGVTAFEEISDGDDSPQQQGRSSGRQSQQPPEDEVGQQRESQGGGQGGTRRGRQRNANQKARKSQVDLLRTLAEELRGENGVERLEQKIGKSLNDLTRAEADEWIDMLTPEEDQ